MVKFKIKRYLYGGHTERFRVYIKTAWWKLWKLDADLDSSLEAFNHVQNLKFLVEVIGRFNYDRKILY